AGRAQDALDRFAKIVKSRPKEKRAIKGLAQTLESQTRRPEALRRAIAFWTDLADLEKDASKEWWDAKERCVMLYCQLGNVRQAEKMTQTLWLTRSDPTDRDRETRWKQAVADAKRAARGA
ncbi:MAG: hypothetical protein II655_03800, partial [Thermoguttaceae bacterium]|nr:hypothetical protein [Thermoguttaceae bacterium]